MLRSSIQPWRSKKSLCHDLSVIDQSQCVVLTSDIYLASKQKRKLATLVLSWCLYICHLLSVIDKYVCICTTTKCGSPKRNCVSSVISIGLWLFAVSIASTQAQIFNTSFRVATLADPFNTPFTSPVTRVFILFFYFSLRQPPRFGFTEALCFFNDSRQKCVHWTANAKINSYVYILPRVQEFAHC